LKTVQEKVRPPSPLAYPRRFLKSSPQRDRSSPVLNSRKVKRLCPGLPRFSGIAIVAETGTGFAFSLLAPWIPPLDRLEQAHRKTALPTNPPTSRKGQTHELWHEASPGPGTGGGDSAGNRPGPGTGGHPPGNGGLHQRAHARLRRRRRPDR